MLDELVSKIFDWFLANGGPGYIMAAVLGLIVYKQDARLAIESAHVLEQYEKRIAEFRELLDVMSSSTNTVSTMHASLSASSEAINQLALGFAKLMNEFHAQQERWDDRRGAMADQLRDIQARLELLQRRAA